MTGILIQFLVIGGGAVSLTLSFFAKTGRLSLALAKWDLCAALAGTALLILSVVLDFKSTASVSGRQQIIGLLEWGLAPIVGAVLLVLWNGRTRP